MLTEKDVVLVKEYVNNKYYDTSKLIKYLDLHDLVGSEVFSYCDRKINGKQTYSHWLEYKGYEPVPTAVFLQRIPFYFYVEKYDAFDLEHVGELNDIYHSYWEKHKGIDIDEIYNALEYMFYDLKIPLDNIFNYWINQEGVVNSYIFFQWNHYLHLCEAQGINEYYPERFITSYNEVLELSGLDPIIYEISTCGLSGPFKREGVKITFEGIFPCDKSGNPIMKWIGIKASNVSSISCSCKKSKSGYLTMIINPDTVIHVLNYYNYRDETEDYWYQVYAGPLTMKFDHNVIKERRLELKFTQKQVAEAIDTSIRTYQKWESGETTPDGRSLIRLLNWLDIEDIQNIIEY